MRAVGQSSKPGPAGATLVVPASLLTVLAVVTAQGIAATGDLGIDFLFYRDVGARFLADGTYYLPHQLAGPYDVALMVDVLYPPSALLLFVPAAVAPWPLWWAIPLAVTAWCIHDWHPAPWGIVAMLLLLCWPRAHAAFLFGNTDMWAMAGVAAGLRFGWPAVLLLLKPTFAPFALAGIRHRSWWLALAGMAAFGLLTLPLWLDYVTAMRNLSAAPDYSLGSLPLLLVPVVASVAQQRQQDDGYFGSRGDANDRHPSEQQVERAATADVVVDLEPDDLSGGQC